MLLDTSGLFCLFNEADEQHGDAQSFFHAATQRLTHSDVLAEFVPLCQARGLKRVDTLEFLADLTDNPFVEVIWVDEALHRAAQSYLEARLDKRYSLCDAISFVVMQEGGITEALTTDHHFEQAGFQKLLR